MTAGSDAGTGLVRGEFVRFLLGGLSPAVDVGGVCRTAGIPYATLHEPLSRVPVERAARALADAERLSGDPLLGLHLVQQRGAGCVLRYLTISQETLAEALATLCRFRALLLSEHALSLTHAGATCTLTVWPGLDGSCRHFIEASLAVISREARDATGRPECVTEVHVRHDAAAPADRYEEALACRVRFAQPHNAVVFAAPLLAARLLRRNPGIASDLGAAARLESEVLSSETVRERVALLFGAGLRARQHTDRAAIARHLLLTSRTLQRRLDAEGVSFNQVADGVRRALALRLTCEQDLDLAAVASDCGFSSVSAFNKAFKRWTGSPPSAFRRTHRGRLDVHGQSPVCRDRHAR